MMLCVNSNAYILLETELLGDLYTSLRGLVTPPILRVKASRVLVKGRDAGQERCLRISVALMAS